MDKWVITHPTHLWPNPPICHPYLWGIWFISAIGDILVSQPFFEFEVGWPSFSLRGISIVFKWILNYISSNFGFFLWFKGIVVFFKASMVFKLFFLLWRYFKHFLDGRGVSAIFWVCGVGWPSFSLRGISVILKWILNYVRTYVIQC